MKTQWLSKLLENILGDYILPAVDKYIDRGQCGGLKQSSISRYLVKLLDFVHQVLDKPTHHAAVLSGEDLSKAFNLGSHQLVIEDLYAMHGSSVYSAPTSVDAQWSSPTWGQSPLSSPYLGGLARGHLWGAYYS